MRVALGDAAKPVGLLEGLGADDDTSDADFFEHQPDRLVITQTAAQFDRDLQSLHDAANGIQVHGTTRLGPVEVDQMQDVAAVRFPTFRHRHRVVAKHRLLGVVPLPQPHTAAPSQIDRGQNLKH